MPLPLIAALAPAALQTVGGIFSSVFSGAHKAEKQLEQLQTPTYNGSRPINSYYNEALRRYGVDPYQSAAYKQQQMEIGRNMNAGLSGLNDRRSGLQGISGLVSASDDAAQNAVVNAEAEQNKRFGELGGATEMKNTDDMKMFETNKLLPFQKQYNLLAMKAGAANSRKAAGIQSAFGGLTNAATILDSKYNK